MDNHRTSSNMVPTELLANKAPTKSQQPKPMQPNTGTNPRHPTTTKAEESLVLQKQQKIANRDLRGIDAMRKKNRLSTNQRISREIEGGMSRDVSYSEQRPLVATVAEDSRAEPIHQLVPTLPSVVPNTNTSGISGYGTLDGVTDEGTLVPTDDDMMPKVGVAAYKRQVVVQQRVAKKQILLKMTIQEIEGSFAFVRPDSVHYKPRAHPSMLLVDDQPGSLRRRLLKMASETTGTNRQFAVKTLVPEEYYQYEPRESPFDGAGRTPSKKLLFPTSTPTSRGEVLLLADALEVMAKKVLTKYPSKPAVGKQALRNRGSFEADGLASEAERAEESPLDLEIDDAKGLEIEQQHSERLSSTLSVLDIVFVEVIRQVACACVERGFLLEHIRECIFSCVKEISERERQSIQKVQEREAVIEQQRREIIGLSESIEELSEQCRAHLYEKQRMARLELAESTSHSKDRVLRSIQMMEDDNSKVQNLLTKAVNKSTTVSRKAKGGLYSDHDSGTKTALSVFGEEAEQKAQVSVVGKPPYDPDDFEEPFDLNQAANQRKQSQSARSASDSVKNPFRLFFDGRAEKRSSQSDRGSVSDESVEDPSKADKFAELGKTMSLISNRFLKPAKPSEETEKASSDEEEKKARPKELVSVSTSTTHDEESEEAAWRRRYTSANTNSVVPAPIPDSNFGEGSLVVSSQIDSNPPRDLDGSFSQSQDVLPHIRPVVRATTFGGTAAAVMAARNLGSSVGPGPVSATKEATAAARATATAVASGLQRPKITIERQATKTEAVQCVPKMRSKETQCFPQKEKKTGKDRGVQFNGLEKSINPAEVFIRLAAASGKASPLPQPLTGQPSLHEHLTAIHTDRLGSSRTELTRTEPTVRTAPLPQKSMKTQTTLCLNDIAKMMSSTTKMSSRGLTPESGADEEEERDSGKSEVIIELEVPKELDPLTDNFYDFYTQTEKFSKLKPKNRTNRWFLGTVLDITTWMVGKDTQDLTAPTMARLLIEFFRNRYGLEALSDGYIADFLHSGRTYCSHTLRGELFTHASMLRAEFKLALPKGAQGAGTSPGMFPDLAAQDARCFYFAFLAAFKKLATSAMMKSLEAGQAITVPAAMVETFLDMLFARRLLPAYVRTFKLALQGWIEKASGAATAESTKFGTVVRLGPALTPPSSWRSAKGPGDGADEFLEYHMEMQSQFEQVQFETMHSGSHLGSPPVQPGSPQGSPRTPHFRSRRSSRGNRKSVSDLNRSGSAVQSPTVVRGPLVTDSIGLDVLHCLLFLSYHKLIHPLLVISSSEASDGDVMVFEEAKLWGMTSASGLHRVKD